MSKPPIKIKPPRLPALEEQEGWETRWQVTLIEPEQRPPPGYAGEPLPRRNLVISTISAQSEHPIEAAELFLQQTTQAVPNLEVNAVPKETTFNDQHPGSRFDISFFATPDVRLLQTHLFRIDDGVLTQLVVTCDDSRQKDQEKLIDTALTFAPDKEEAPRSK